MKADRRLEEMVQSCLEGLDAGLTPEECLSPWPERRGELEPLFREALLLRAAFASAPREEFRSLAKERLLFAAGREARAALAREPDQRFANLARYRLLQAAGAQVQESLRSVPPPRLAFWVNARRRLLQAAAVPRQAARRPVAIAVRWSLSAAVLVLAIGIAGLAFLTSESSPPSVSAQLAQLERDVAAVREQAAAGEPVSVNVISDLVRRTNDLVDKVVAGDATKLHDTINRQQEVVELVAGPRAELMPLRQQLDEAEEKVTRISAAAQDPTGSQPTRAPSSPTPAATQTPIPFPTSAPVAPGQVSVSLFPSDRTLSLDWVEVRTANLRFLVPSRWQVTGFSQNASGVATLESHYVIVYGPSNLVMLVDTRSGEISALVESQALTLREGGVSGAVVSIDELVAKAASIALELRHLLGSLRLFGELADGTPTPVTTPTPAATRTPLPSATATPPRPATESR